ncbi:hypothetical protein D6C92_09769 [Aureobasidium pullulans]|nr:hypothetical protein D6C92_09769 [Aureobasidium pullulans]
MSGELTINVRDNIAGANATQIINTVIRQPTASIQACLRALDCPDAGAIKTEIHSADGVILECIEWIFQDDRFLKWKEPGENSVLWINGSPGKGKTRMATGIVDSLLKETDNSTVNGIAGFFFCQCTDDRLNNAVGVLKGIIRSLIEQRPLTVEHLHRHWIDEEQIFDMDFNQIAPLWTVLKRIINDNGHLVTHIVIDAIDECNHQTEELLRLIFTDGLAFPRSIKWLLTSRPLSLRLQEIIYGSSEQIEVDLDGSSGQVEDAVKRYIKVKTRWMNNNRFSMVDQVHINESLFTNSESTFLWVAFVCQEVRNLPAAEVIQAVLAMPKGLRNLYERIAALDKTHPKLRMWSTVGEEELAFVHLRILEAELPSIDLHILVAELPMLEHETLQFCCNDKFIVYEAHDERKQFLLVCDLEKADVMVQTKCIDHNRTWMQYPWAISPGGEYFASTTQGDKSLPFVAKISIREIPTRRVMFTILVSAISGLALSTNPLRVAAASHDGTIRVWDIDEARSHDYVQSAIDIYSGIPSTSSRILSLSESWMGGCFQCLAAAWLPSPDCEFLLFLGSLDGLSKNLLTLAHTSCGYSRDISGPWELGTILTCTFSPDGSLLTICYYVEDSSFSGGRSSGTFLTTYEVSIEHLHDQSFDPRQLSLWTSHVITTADDTERTTLATKPASAAVTYSEDQSLILCSFLIGNRAVFGELDVHDRNGKYALVDLKSSLLTDRAGTTQAICVSPDHHLIACSFSLKARQGPSCVNCKQVHEVSRVYILQDYRYHSDAFGFETQDVSLLKFSHSAELLVALSEGRQHIKVFKILQISAKTSHDATDPPQQLHLIAEFTDHGFISDVEFTKNNRALRTNRGTIQLFSDLPSASLSSAAPLPGLYFDGQWICMMENPILYIPAEYRPASGNRKLGFLEHN